MPTGYTHAVQTGEITTLNEFAMKCARAMGACIMMRDDPSDAEIPERFEPNTDYHDKAIEEANKVLDALPRMAISNAEELAQNEYDEAVVSRNKYIADKKEHQSRYESMVTKVEAWTPMGGVTGLKDFMLEQLSSSIDFDCGSYKPEMPEKLDGAAWMEAKRDKAISDLEYHTKQRQDEITRTEGRNQFLTDLRSSLQEQSS